MPISTEAKFKTHRFEAVALAHIDSIYRFALCMAENEGDAQRLVQNTYLKAYRSFDRFAEGMNCKTWLFTILNNTFANTIYRDRRHLRIAYPPGEEEYGVELSDNADPEDEIFKDPLDDHAVVAITELPVTYRAAVLLADVEGLSYREIADIVGCPIGTVMSRVCRGRRLLRRRL